MAKPRGKTLTVVNQKGGTKVLKLKTAIIGIVVLVVLLPTITLASIDVYFSLVDDPEGAIIEELGKAEESMTLR